MEQHGSESGNEENGSSYEEGYGPPPEGRAYGREDEAPPESGGLPQEAAGPAERYAGSGQMSINSPTALDSWHGYDVDCPALDREK